MCGPYSKTFAPIYPQMNAHQLLQVHDEPLQHSCQGNMVLHVAECLVPRRYCYHISTLYHTWPWSRQRSDSESLDSVHNYSLQFLNILECVLLISIYYLEVSDNQLLGTALPLFWPKRQQDHPYLPQRLKFQI